MIAQLNYVLTRQEVEGVSELDWLRTLLARGCPLDVEFRPQFKRNLSVWRTIRYRYYRIVAKRRLLKRIRRRYCHAFSRFVKLTPLKSTSGLNASKALIYFVGTFVWPRIIHSDRGTQLLSDMITSLITESFPAF
jgi:hypothetical protein